MKKTILLAASMALLSGMAFAGNDGGQGLNSGSSGDEKMTTKAVMGQLNVWRLTFSGTMPGIYKQSYDGTKLSWTLAGGAVVQLDTSTCTEKNSQGYIKITFGADALACAPASSQ